MWGQKGDIKLCVRIFWCIWQPAIQDTGTISLKILDDSMTFHFWNNTLIVSSVSFPISFFVRYSLIYFECIFSALPPHEALCSFCTVDANCEVSHQFSYFSYTVRSLDHQNVYKIWKQHTPEKSAKHKPSMTPLLLPHW